MSTLQAPSNAVRAVAPEDMHNPARNDNATPARMTRFIMISRCASPADRLCALEEHVSAAARLPTRRRPRAVASRLCCQCRLVGESAALAVNDAIAIGQLYSLWAIITIVGRGLSSSMRFWSCAPIAIRKSATVVKRGASTNATMICHPRSDEMAGEGRKIMDKGCELPRQGAKRRNGLMVLLPRARSACRKTAPMLLVGPR